MEEIEFSWWLFDGRLRQEKKVLPDGLNWLCYFAGSSKSHRENSCLSYFWNPLSSRHEKRCQILQTFFRYFNTLETPSAVSTIEPLKKVINSDFCPIFSGSND